MNGTVSDPTGAVVAGARVTATNRNTGLVRETKTTDAGVYTFQRLPVGTYDVRVEIQGFKTASRTEVPVNVGSVPTIDVTLEIGNTAEQVTVAADAPVVETTRSQTSTVVQEKLIRDLPINGRNFLDFTTLTPGVVRDPRGGDLSFGGQRGTLNSFLVDGVDSNNVFFGQSTGRQGVRNPYAYSQDAIQEFQVNTNSFAAELGRAAGGVVNVITKSGTNDFHGTGFFFYRDTKLNANNAFNKSLGRDRLPYRFKQFGGNLGGPIKRDKLFFFYNYDGQRNSTPVNVFSAAPVNRFTPAELAVYNTLSQYFVPYDQGLNNDVHLAKIDWNISTNQTLNFRYNGNRFTGRNFENGGSQRAPESTGNSRVFTDGFAGTYTYVFGGRTVLDTRFNYVKDNQPGEANSSLPETTIRQGGQNVITFGRNNFSPRYTNTQRYQTIATLSSVVGSHTIKFGGDLNVENIENFFPGQFSGVYLFNSLLDFQNRVPATFSQALPGPGTSGALSQPNFRELGLFVQDQWRVTQKLTLNLGARYDIFRVAQPPVRNPNTLLEQGGLRTDRINNDNNNMAYRFGFAYKPLNSERLVVRGGSGMFYGRIPAILLGTIHTNNGLQVQNYTFTGAGIPVTYPNVLTAIPAGITRTPNIFAAAPNLQWPLTYQWSLNVETQLGGNTALTVGYLGVKGQNLTRSRDINLFPPQQFNGTLSTGGAQPYFRYTSARPNPAFGRVTLVDSGADSAYHAGFVQISKRFGQSFQLQSSYTFSKVIDDAPNATSVLPGNGGDDSQITQFTLYPNLDRGRGNADVPHRFVLSGVVDFGFARGIGNPFARWALRDWQVSSIFQAQSGRVFSQLVNVDLNNDGNPFSDRVPFVGRNTERLPMFATLDARLSRYIPLGTERLRLQIIGEAFNLTNRSNIASVNQNRLLVNTANFVFTPNPSYRAVTSTGDPRILQLAARIIF